MMARRFIREALWTAVALGLAVIASNHLLTTRREHARLDVLTKIELGRCNPYLQLLDRTPDDEDCVVRRSQRAAAGEEAAAAVPQLGTLEWSVVGILALTVVVLGRGLLWTVQRGILTAAHWARTFPHWLETFFVSGTVVLAFGTAGLLSREESEADRYLFTIGTAVALTTGLLWYRRHHAP